MRFLRGDAQHLTPESHQVPRLNGEVISLNGSGVCRNQRARYHDHMRQHNDDCFSQGCTRLAANCEDEQARCQR
jgi:hypothetical protein